MGDIDLGDRAAEAARQGDGGTRVDAVWVWFEGEGEGDEEREVDGEGEQEVEEEVRGERTGGTEEVLVRGEMESVREEAD
jgi:hypothetical protein